MDFESNMLTSHICLTEHMPEILTKMYKDLGMKINNEEMAKNVSEVFAKNMQGQNPSQCLLVVLYMLREIYRQMQNETVSVDGLSPDFLKILNKNKINHMYG